MEVNRLPFVSVITVVPNTALGAARVMQRAASGVADAGLRASASVAGSLAVRAEPVVKRMLEGAVALLPIEAILARVDVDALVHQVDVDGIVGRVDVAAIVDRIDLPRIISDVLAEIELGDLIHDSTTSIVSEARDAARVQAMNVDGRLAHIVDRVLRRRGERDLSVPGFVLGGAT